MKFKKHILLFSLIISFCFVFFGTASILPKKIVFANEVQETDSDGSGNVSQEINDFSELKSGTSESNKELYQLDKNSTYSITSSLGNVNYIILNGNGATITIKSGISLFESLTNVEIYNLNIKIETESKTEQEDSESKTEQEDSDTTTEFSITKTSYGILANKISNSNIYAINFKDVNMVLNGADSQSVSTANIGLLAGQISDSNINQIKIDGCSIKTKEDCTIKTNSNIGLLAGKIERTRLQNNIVTNSTLNISVGKTESKSYNFGGLVGYVDSSFKISNNIVDFSNDENKIQLKSNYYNFGYLIGKTETSNISIFNNAIFLSNTPDKNMEELFVGSVIGYMNKPLSTNSIFGNYASEQINYIGNLTIDQAINAYDGFKKLSKNEICTKIELNSEEDWETTELWDFDNIWIKTSNRVLPSLQYFEEYSISVSQEGSINKLGIDQLPSKDIIKIEINNDKIYYGDTVTITATINSINEVDFNKFFKITGLYLNGTVVYHFDEDDSSDHISHTKTKTNDIIFTINNFTAKDVGEYCVELTPVKYSLKITVYDASNEESQSQKTVAHIKPTEGSKPLGNDDIITLEYGHYYSYETYQVDSDYSKAADWYVITEQNFNLENVEANIDGKSKISWWFDEKWEFLSWKASSGSDDNDGDSTGKNLFNLEEGTQLQLVAAFTSDVAELNIKFQKDNADGEVVLEKIAKIKIDGDNSKINFDEETGIYSIKKKHGKHNILLEEISTEYEFLGWTDESGVSAGVDDDGTFEISEEENSFVLCAIFKKVVEEKQASLLWLWITLGAVGVLAVVAVIVIIVIKKKNSGGSSYRKYMY